MHKKLLIILGPTAVGKSGLAVALAKKYRGEIISADSRQVYRGLTIGTGKISRKEMRGIPHHLIDVADPKKQFSVADFIEQAEKKIGEIEGRGKLPIICGGTGFYISSLLREETIPNVPPNKKLRAKLGKKSISNLLRILRKLDERRAKTIDKKNPRRLIRAIEVAQALGSVPKASAKTRYRSLKIGITLPNNTLRKKINDRLLLRIKRGMVSEAKALHRRGLSWKRMRALGLEYRYLGELLQGRITKEEMIEKLKVEIWRYAKRQRTWFKRDKDILWFSPDQTKQISMTIEKRLR